MSNNTSHGIKYVIETYEKYNKKELIIICEGCNKRLTFTIDTSVSEIEKPKNT